MALRLCLFLAKQQEESKKKVVISICLLTQKRLIRSY